jgi:hypothetical protein
MESKKVEKKNNKRKNVKRKEVCETFKVKEGGKEKIVESCGVEEEKIATEGQIKKHNELFKIILFVMIGFIAFFLVIIFLNYSVNHFKIEGVEFERDTKTMEGVMLYKTIIPGTIDKEGNFIVGIYDGKEQANYRVWFRNDPRILKDTPFEGEINLLKLVVWNQTKDYVCNGDYIGIQNLLNVYDVIGVEVIKDDNANCDELGRYTYITILEGDETRIEQVGLECYNIYVKDCEILSATERFMLEVLIEINKEIKNAK